MNQNKRPAGSIKSADPNIPGNSTMLNVPVEKKIASIPISINALPSKVNIRNFIAEYSFLPLPQIDIRKYIGMSSNSQNIKNITRSRETNTPTTAVWSISSQAKYSLTLKVTCQDANTAHTPSMEAKVTNGKLNPSIPMW